MNKLIILIAAVLMSACTSSKGAYFSSSDNNESLKDAKTATLDHSTFDKQLKKYVNEKGFVNYASWKKEEKQLQDYLAYLNENEPTKSFSKQEQFAYYINLYNAATVSLILENNMPKSIKDIDGPLGQVWLKKFVSVNDNKLSLADIEKSILQKMGDPRIHFAINCASYSCPKLQNEAYTAKNINTLMDKAAEEFINSDKNVINANNPKLSSIFDWYSGDFKENGGTVIKFINTYSKIKIKDNAKISYLDYNWSLNKQ